MKLYQVISPLHITFLSCYLKVVKLQLQVQCFFGSGTAESPISHLVRTTATAARVQQILNHVIG